MEQRREKTDASRPRAQESWGGESSDHVWLNRSIKIRKLAKTWGFSGGTVSHLWSSRVL